MADLQRRRFIKACAGLAAAGFPAIIKARNSRPKLRVVGTHVTLQEALRQRAEQDLGIDLEFQPGGSAAVLLKASTDPDAFDVYEQWSNSIRPCI